ncbi:MAG: homoserine kinase [Acetilactobacillus jinshanensis]
MKKIVIRIPATSSNLGAGINSLGIAFALYSTVIVEEKTDHWRVNHSLKGIPHDSSNLIVQTILRINPRIAPRQLTVMSDIPQAHGLGHSTASIIAGIKIANVLGHMKLTLDQQIDIGNRLVGHPECIASGILGDLTASFANGKRVSTVKTHMPQVSALMYIIPHYNSNHHKVYPIKKVPLLEMIQSIDVSNVLIAAVMDNRWTKASMMMEKDPIKAHHRKKGLHDLKVIRQQAHKLGIYGTYLNGQGPLIVTFGQRIELNRLHDRLSDDPNLKGAIRILDIDRNGTTVRGE